MIPDFQSIMHPLLSLVKDGREYNIKDCIEPLSKHFNLTEEEITTCYPTQDLHVFLSRVRWASTYLKKALLLESTKRSYIKITDRGKEVLNKNVNYINIAYLKQFPEINDLIKRKRMPQTSMDIEDESYIKYEKLLTPEEELENAYQKLRFELVDEILAKLKQSSPEFFERTVIDLLLKMGYGGSLREMASSTKKSNDMGIDGIIKQDKLGLDSIYIQAKRWDNSPVGRKEIQAFVGALEGQLSHKGIFITTSRFTSEAYEYIKTINKKIVLIDGNMLCHYMIEYGLGVHTIVKYDIKRIDNDFFE